MSGLLAGRRGRLDLLRNFGGENRQRMLAVGRVAQEQAGPVPPTSRCIRSGRDQQRETIGAAVVRLRHPGAAVRSDPWRQQPVGLGDHRPRRSDGGHWNDPPVATPQRNLGAIKSIIGEVHVTHRLGVQIAVVFASYGLASSALCQGVVNLRLG